MKGPSPKAKKVIKIVLWSFLGAILLFILIVVGTLLVKKYIKKDPVPMFAGYSPLIVATGSMNGTIDEGDLIIIKKTNDYWLGDIVTFIDYSAGGAIVTHRIIREGPEPGTFITRGDANDGDDAAISVDQILGEWVATIPKVGLFFKWFLYEYGIVYLVAIIAVITAGVYFWKHTKDEEPEEVAEGAGEGPAEGSLEASPSADMPGAGAAEVNEAQEEAAPQQEEQPQDPNE